MKQAIGIIGGMGPQASSYLYNLLIKKAVESFGAKHGDEFPEIIIHSIPVPDFISNKGNQKTALDMLKRRVQMLNHLELSCLSIACNTAHLLLPDLQTISKTPFLSMIDEVVRVVSKKKIQRVGLLGTPSTIKSGLYHRLFEEHGIAVVQPEENQISVLERIIRNVIAGKILQSDAKKLVLIAYYLQEKGAEGIVLGCTELPLIFPKKNQLPVFSSLEVLALALLRKYYKSHRIRKI